MSPPDEPAASPPVAPRVTVPAEDWPHAGLVKAVRETLFALPSFFKSDLVISGVLATDLFTFNASLGATIEVQVVAALNALRQTWDPQEKYRLYSFVRQAQRFPDVILRTATPGLEPVLLGIELKGWYVLAREREPSFRYRVTPAVCAPADLLVVYPWALSNVISGSPRLFAPYVVSARSAAEYRNWHWQHAKEGVTPGEIELSRVDHYYPVKSDKISDVAKHDSGGNFGRFARTGLMAEYSKMLFRETLAGIELDSWQKFLSRFSSGPADT